MCPPNPKPGPKLKCIAQVSDWKTLWVLWNYRNRGPSEGPCREPQVPGMGPEGTQPMFDHQLLIMFNIYKAFDHAIVKHRSSRVNH